MNPTASAARARLSTLERELVSAKTRVDLLERSCVHQWSSPVYTPDVREAYIEADAPGTMGIDWRPATHVPRSETPKWTRTCAVCGKTETTTKTIERVTTSPSF